MDGLLLIDKPSGCTSHDIVNRVRKVCVEKVGHTGTLDPLATGLLPLCIGKTTKISQWLLAEDKTYEFTFRLGIVTDTYDIEGKILEENPVPDLTEADLEQVLADFRGNISQVPPMFSAVKQDGRRLYKLARQGITVERQARPLTVHSLEITDFKLPDVKMRARIGKGGYIRSLAHDIGQKLGSGATILELRRITTGFLNVKNAKSPEELDSRDKILSAIISTRQVLKDWPAFVVKNEFLEKARNGMTLSMDEIDFIDDVESADQFCLGLSDKENVVGLYKSGYTVQESDKKLTTVKPIKILNENL
jgi:tRNA pseudouridine55 synthase